MDTLKPLLIVAVLAGIGYGVYVRLNAGSDAPPPPVSEDWDTTPKVQLPDQSNGAPWTPPGASVGDAPPPFAQAPAAAAASGDAPPFAGGAPTNPPGSIGPPDGPPPEATASVPPTAPAGAPFAAAPPAGHDPAGQAPPFAGAPGEPTDPYASTPSDPYGTPADPNSAPPQDAAPTDPYADPYQASPGDAYPTGPNGTPPGDAPPAGEGTAAPAPPANTDYAAALETAKRDLEAGQLAAALKQLSSWYDNPQLSAADQQQLSTLLDQVAGTVVYSTQSLLGPPYEVQPGERLEDIGEKCGVPWQLLAKINGIDDPATLQPGERLKVVKGPFHAVVSLDKRELALFLADGSYAGRFKIGVGAEHPPQEGTFTVSDKVVNPVYYGKQRAISADDPANPLGERWIGLGQNLAIHGTNDPQNIGRNDLPGSISLSERDAADVYDILSLGSKVTIRR